MAYGVRVTENTECFEVYNEEGIDRQRIDPHLVQTQVKWDLRQQLKLMLEEIAEAEADEQIGAFESPVSVEIYVYGIVCQKKMGKSPGKIYRRSSPV